MQCNEIKLHRVLFGALGVRDCSTFTKLVRKARPERERKKKGKKHKHIFLVTFCYNVTMLIYKHLECNKGVTNVTRM